jgi:Mce-associated membrane protein
VTKSIDTAEEKEQAVPVDTETVTDAQTSQADAEPTQVCESDSDDVKGESTRAVRGVRCSRALAYGVLPALALLLAMGAGGLRWLDSSVRDSAVVRVESVRVATDATVALLSYKPDTVEKDLGAARDRLAGNLRDSYTSLTRDVVIPGSKQKQISAVATVPAAASVSATENHAVVLVFVNQTVVIGNDAPTDTASTVRVTLDRIHGRWLITQFDPV